MCAVGGQEEDPLGGRGFLCQEGEPGRSQQEMLLRPQAERGQGKAGLPPPPTLQNVLDPPRIPGFLPRESRCVPLTPRASWDPWPDGTDRELPRTLENQALPQAQWRATLWEDRPAHTLPLAAMCSHLRRWGGAWSGREGEGLWHSPTMRPPPGDFRQLRAPAQACSGQIRVRKAASNMAERSWAGGGGQGAGPGLEPLPS